MPKNRVTLKDIAEATGFTINTISRALHDKNDISAATKELIKTKAKSMGYVGHQFAASLRSGKSKTIAVILGDIANPLFAKQIKEIEAELYHNFYNTIIFNTNENSAIERTAVLAAIAKNVDGIIICPTEKSQNNIELIISSGLPYVLLGRHIYKTDYNYCILDDQKGGFLATEHLIKLGHKDIMFLGLDYDFSSVAEREEGYKKALRSYGLDNRKLIRYADLTFGSCYKIISNLLKEKIKFSAIFAFSDILALEAVYALKELGKSVPDDISIVGFDNIGEHYYLPPALDTIGQSDKSLTKCACDFLLTAIEAPEKSSIAQKLDVSLTVRGSCIKAKLPL